MWAHFGSECGNVVIRFLLNLSKYGSRASLQIGMNAVKLLQVVELY